MGVVCALGMLCLPATAPAAGGSALGWGYNSYGQVGNGTPTTTGCQCVPTATPVLGLSDVTQVSTGYAHALALRSNGTVASWGFNEQGQLGNGTTANNPTPAPVLGLANVVEIATSYEHSLALLADGTVMAWGDNYRGELGVGGSNFAGGGPEACGSSSACSKVPRPVPGLSDVVAIDTGPYTSLALLGNGTVMAWGYDLYGFLGDGTGIQSGCQCVDHPVPVPGVSGAMGVSASYHGMALLANGTITAWGQDTDGQIGNGIDFEAPPPACQCFGPVSVTGLSGPVRQISAAGYHSVAVLAGGTAQAWGYNYEGELGTGRTEQGCYCIPAPGSPVLGLAGAQSVATGEYDTLALLGDGTVRSWGYNSEGQLGDGTEEDRSAPVPVGGVFGASEVASGAATSMALVGPSHQLTVSFAGAGAGNVGGPKNIVCPAVSCDARFPDSQVEILRAEPVPSSGFAGFTGACTGTARCQVRMDADRSVTATFGPPAGTAIIKAKITQGKKQKKAKASSKRPKPTAKAKFTFTAPGAVTGYECMLVKPKPKKQKKAKGSKKKKPKFSSCASPKQYKNLKKGSYTFKVRARNNLGVDAKPALKKFKIKR